QPANRYKTSLIFILIFCIKAIGRQPPRHAGGVAAQKHKIRKKGAGFGDKDSVAAANRTRRRGTNDGHGVRPPFRRRWPPRARGPSAPRARRAGSVAAGGR